MPPSWDRRHALCSAVMPRRAFLARIAGGLLAAPLAAQAQPAAIACVGFFKAPASGHHAVPPVCG